MILGHKRSKVLRLAMPTAVLVLAGCNLQIFPGQHFPVHEKIIVKNWRGAGQKEGLLGGFGRSWRGYPLLEKFVVRKYAERAAGGLAPFVAQQLAFGRHFEIRFLTRRIAPGRIFELRLDDGRAVLLLNVKGLGRHTRALDEDAERAGVYGWVGRRFGLVFFVPSVSIRRHGRGQNHRQSTAHWCFEPHSTSPCSVRAAIFFRPSASVIS